MTTKTRTPAAQAATSVRRALKEAGIAAVSVKSRNFAGGNAVNIVLADPTPRVHRQAGEIARRHQYGSFDGMEDIYRYDNEDQGVPQAKYVHVSPQYSRELRQRVEAFLQEKFQDYVTDPRAYPQQCYVHWTLTAARPVFSDFWPAESQ